MSLSAAASWQTTTIPPFTSRIIRIRSQQSLISSPLIAFDRTDPYHHRCQVLHELHLLEPHSISIGDLSVLHLDDVFHEPEVRRFGLLAIEKAVGQLALLVAIKVLLDGEEEDVNRCHVLQLPLEGEVLNQKFDGTIALFVVINPAIVNIIEIFFELAETLIDLESVECCLASLDDFAVVGASLRGSNELETVVTFGLLS